MRVDGHSWWHTRVRRNLRNGWARGSGRECLTILATLDARMAIVDANTSKHKDVRHGSQSASSAYFYLGHITGWCLKVTAISHNSLPRENLCPHIPLRGTPNTINFPWDVANKFQVMLTHVAFCCCCVIALANLLDKLTSYWDGKFIRMVGIWPIHQIFSFTGFYIDKTGRDTGLS